MDEDEKADDEEVSVDATDDDDKVENVDMDEDKKDDVTVDATDDDDEMPCWESDSSCSVL